MRSSHCWNKQIIKGRWVRRNFWVKIPGRGEPSDFNWKLGYPMGVRPKGVNPGDAIGSSIYKINSKDYKITSLINRYIILTKNKLY